MFSAHSAESDWEWARKRRTLFKTPTTGVLAGIATFMLGILVRALFGEPNWFKASLIAAIIAVAVAIVPSQIETWLIWRKRHKVRLEDAKEKIATLEATSVPTAPPSDKPLASPVLVANKTGWARLRITNKGAGAVFSATVQPYGLTAGAVQGRLVPAQWQEVDSPTQRIARDDTRVLMLASLTNLGVEGVNGWKIHRADGPDIGGVDAEDVLDVTVVADPDLAKPCQLRVVLRPDPTQSELIRLPIETVPSEPVEVEHSPMKLVLPHITQKSEADYPMLYEIESAGQTLYIELHSATYGFRDGSRDALSVVRDAMTGTGIDLIVNNDTMGGDPCPGAQKELVVEYSIDRQAKTARKKEHERLRIP